MSEPVLHEQAARISFLLGTWQGAGKGEYPTIDPFAYEEEIRFTHNGKPFLAYTQRTWHPEKKHPMHGEAGYFRPLENGGIEIVLAHPTGIVEIQEGTIEGTRITTRSKLVGKTTTAKEVTQLERVFAVNGDVMRYEVRMAAVGQPLQHHLSAELKRVG
ncbi:MAG: FABP family protein [Actinobacteria bacterium]|nr:MAG: FABP family protein [Actinomycetota bacterium]